MKKVIVCDTGSDYLKSQIEYVLEHINTEGTESYTEITHDCDVLIKINNKIEFNKSGIFKLANILGSLKASWEIAHKYKQLFENSVVYLHKNDDKHSLFLKGKCFKNPDNIKLVKHANTYHRFKTSRDVLERDRALICSLMNIEYFLESHSRDEVIKIINDLIINTRLPLLEYEPELRVITKILGYELFNRSVSKVSSRYYSSKNATC